MKLTELNTKISQGNIYWYTDDQLLEHRYELKEAISELASPYRKRLTKVNLEITNRRYLAKKVWK